MCAYLRRKTRAGADARAHARLCVWRTAYTTYEMNSHAEKHTQSLFNTLFASMKHVSNRFLCNGFHWRSMTYVRIHTHTHTFTYHIEQHHRPLFSPPHCPFALVIVYIPSSCTHKPSQKEKKIITECVHTSCSALGNLSSLYPTEMTNSSDYFIADSFIERLRRICSLHFRFTEQKRSEEQKKKLKVLHDFAFYYRKCTIHRLYLQCFSSTLAGCFKTTMI